jgi:hypothetical protein
MSIRYFLMVKVMHAAHSTVILTNLHSLLSKEKFTLLCFREAFIMSSWYSMHSIIDSIVALFLKKL